MWKLMNTYGMHKSYAQAGEDRILDYILNQKQEGVYIDIGSNHPILNSITYLFYLRGWQGLCIDPNPTMIALANKLRPRDKNLCVGVAASRDFLDYYQFESSGLNTFNEKYYEYHIPNHRFKGKTKVQVIPLSELCAEYKVPKTSVDFLSVDAEGMDLEVLQSNDWSKFSPRIILVEVSEDAFEICGPTISFLKEQGYKLIAKAGATAFLKRVL
jgi:FkbM family methyltransferase